MLVIGLTGGMASGKSTIAALFRRAHVPVFDADACVRALQAPGGAALGPIGKAFAGTVVDGRLDRAALRSAVAGNPAALKRLEAIVHPLVRAARERFIRLCRAHGERLCVLDVPLLMEAGEDRRCDLVVVVEAPLTTRLARIRRRQKGGARMDEAQARALLARQMSDAERRRRADIVIPTGLSRGAAAARVRALLAALRDNPLSLKGGR